MGCGCHGDIDLVLFLEGWGASTWGGSSTRCSQAQTASLCLYVLFQYYIQDDFRLKKKKNWIKKKEVIFVIQKILHKCIAWNGTDHIPGDQRMWPTVGEFSHSLVSMSQWASLWPGTSNCISLVPSVKLQGHLNLGQFNTNSLSTAQREAEITNATIGQI